MKNKLSLLYKILIVIVSGIGIYLNFKMASGLQVLFYFTIISNILCLGFYLIEVILELLGKIKRGRLFHILKGTVIMCITLTLAVYQFVLADKGIYDGHMLECNFVHLFTPLLVIFDYIMFCEKGHIEKDFPITWSLSILIYGLICELYINFGGNFLGGSKYPYFFLDIEKYGISGVIGNLTFVYILFLLYGYLVYFIDKKLGKRNK